MEAIMILILSVSMGYLVNKIDKFEDKLDKLENKVIEMDSHLLRRRGDPSN